MKLNWHKDIFMQNKPRHFQSGAAFTKWLIWNFFFPGLFWPSFKYGPQFVALPSLVFEVPLCLDQSIHISRPVIPVCHSNSPPSEQPLKCVLWQVCRVVCPCVFSKHKWYCLVSSWVPFPLNPVCYHSMPLCFGWLLVHTPLLLSPVINT